MTINWEDTMDLVNRPRRLRRTDAIRRLNRETRLSPEALIYPIFVFETLSGVRPIERLPGQNHYGLDSVILSMIVRWGNRLNCWKTMPIFCLTTLMLTFGVLINSSST